MNDRQEDNATGYGPWLAGLAVLVGGLLALAGFWDGALAWLLAHAVGVLGLALALGGLIILDRLTGPQAGEPPPEEEASPGKGGPGPGHTSVGPVGIVVASVYIVAVALLLLYSLFALWPDNTPRGLVADAPTVEAPAPGAAADADADVDADTLAVAAPAVGSGYRRLPCDTTRLARLILPDSILDPDCERLAFTGPFVLSYEQRLLLIVILAGALGGLIHALRSLYWYAGNRRLKRSWLLMYVLQPLVGAGMATIFYLAVKGGFFVDGGNPGDANPFGFAGLAAIVGMFSTQAALKLKQVAEIVFAAAEEGADAQSQAADGKDGGDGRDGGGGGDGGGAGSPGGGVGGGSPDAGGGPGLGGPDGDDSGGSGAGGEGGRHGGP